MSKEIYLLSFASGVTALKRAPVFSPGARISLPIGMSEARKGLGFGTDAKGKQRSSSSQSHQINPRARAANLNLGFQRSEGAYTHRNGVANRAGRQANKNYFLLTSGLKWRIWRFK
jgi:hypothetical protein